MTSVFGDDHFDGSGDKLTARITTRLAHAMIYLIPVAIASRVIYYVFRSTTWVAFLDLFLGLLLLVCYLVSIQHQVTARLCIRCMEEVPVDASERAQRQHLWLRIQHMSGKTMLIILAVLLAPPWLASAFLDLSERGQSLLGLGLDVWTFSLMYSMWLHHRLRPWCPYCRRWDDDGDAEWVPDPVPAEGKKIA
jgi:hypothetical protein